MKLSEMYECLDRLQKIYEYKDAETDVQLEHDIRSGRQNRVTIQTYDEETSVDIRLSTVVKD